MGRASPSPPARLVLAQDTAQKQMPIPGSYLGGTRGTVYVHRPLLRESDDVEAFPFAVQGPQILLRLQRSRGLLDKSHASLARSSRRLKRLT